MTPISTSVLSSALHWRYATKKFDATRKIPAETWTALEEALVLAPSSYGLQPWKFIVVEDPAKRALLSAASHGQRQAIDCSHFVVIAGRKNYSEADLAHYIARIAEVRGGDPDSLKGYAEIVKGSIERSRSAGLLDAWMGKQAYIALGLFLTAAALLAIDTCPMEGIEPEKFDDILGLPALGYATLCAAPAGYRAADDRYASQLKVRFSAAEVIMRA